MSRRPRIQLAALAVLVAIAVPATAAAAPGDLDTSFGSGGVASSPFPTVATTDDIARAIVLQPDGRLVVTGEAQADGRSFFALARYDPDGSFADGFGEFGVVIADLSGATDARPRAIALQPDGKLVVGGFVTVGDSVRFAVARFNPAGTLDATFGSGGWVVVDVSSGADIVKAVAVLGDGKIAIAGQSGDRPFIARLDRTGALDLSFGGGIVVFNVPGGGDYADLVAEDDGGLVVAGTYRPDGEPSRFLLGRYRADGSFDTTFGPGGTVSEDLGGGNEVGTSLVRQADGKYVVAGFERGDGGRAVVARYGPSGALDRGFGENGIFLQRLTLTADDELNDLALQPDGKIVAVGASGINLALLDSFVFAVLRLATDGRPDATFGGGDGVATTSARPQSFHGGAGVALQEDGKIVLAGTLNSFAPGSAGDFALARYQGDLADLVTEVSASPNPAQPGQPITYTATVTNRGPETAERAELHLNVAGLVSVGDEVPCTRGTRSGRCELGTIPPGAGAAITFVARKRLPGDLVGQAQAASITLDPDTANNAANQTVRVADTVAPRARAELLAASIERLVVGVRSSEAGRVEIVATAGRGRSRVTVARGDAGLRRQRARRVAAQLTEAGQQLLVRTRGVLVVIRVRVRDRAGNVTLVTLRQTL